MVSNSITLPEALLEAIVDATGAASVRVERSLQELWSGYGCIVQLSLSDAATSSVILKLIEPPQRANHPRGWNTSTSHLRKLRSYEIETLWYQLYADQCNEHCKVPSVIKASSNEFRQWILMEDLSEVYPLRASQLSLSKAQVCLRWLAAFHAKFLHHNPTGLWPIGTYWHLETRSDELAAMPEGPLKDHAFLLDNALNNSRFQSIVHGDAKVANFCFSQNWDSVAAVDFQYVGGGVGIKDVAYFLGSCLDEATIENHESTLLSVYFEALHAAISDTHGQKIADLVEQDWSALYAIAWTDFYRFLEGWMPGHKKINCYTKQLAHRAFDQLASR